MAGKNRQLTAALLAPVILTGCAGLPRGPGYAHVSPGATVTLDLPDNDRRTGTWWIQNGHGQKSGVPDRYGAPFCRIDSANAVNGVWRVTGFDVRKDFAGRQAPNPRGFGHDLVDLLDYTSRFDLSADDGRVALLECSRTGVEPRGRYLRPRDINAVLGSAGTLRLPDQ